MDMTCSQQHKADSATQNPRKRKRKQKQKKVDALSVERQNATRIDDLPFEILTAILSCMSLKEAARTSVLSRNWRYLWMFICGTLDFDDWDSATGTEMKRKEFKAWVNLVLKLHQGPRIDSLIIRFRHARRRSVDKLDIDNWIYFAMQKEVKTFELNLFHCKYNFPDMIKLLSCSHEVKSAFGSLRSLRLVGVDIKDEVVQYFLASCPYLEQLCIRSSNATKNLQVLDPLPNLKVLEIHDCDHIQSLEISAMNLVSCAYQGPTISSAPFKKTPNLSDLTLGGVFSESFLYEPSTHSSYSVQLVKLVLNLETLVPEREIVAPADLPLLYSLKQLELNIVSPAGRGLLFFTSLIKASPYLHEFKIKIDYLVSSPWCGVHTINRRMPFPEVSPVKIGRFRHKNLKLLEMDGYTGCASEDKFLKQLFKFAPSLEMVVIDTQSRCCYANYGYDDVSFLDYFTVISWRAMAKMRWRIGARTKMQAEERAQNLKSSCPLRTNFVIT